LPEILEQFEFPSLCSTIAGAFEAVESLDITAIAREREVPIEHVLMPMKASKIQVPVNVFKTTQKWKVVLPKPLQNIKAALHAGNLSPGPKPINLIADVARSHELDGPQLVHDVPARFVHLRQSEVVFHVELAQHLRLEQIGHVPHQRAEQHVESSFLRELDPFAPPRLHGCGAGQQWRAISTEGALELFGTLVAFSGT
tara:strand:- start:138 stop:734 length:597 start_codon:yes stop_codon:yes gene_type:complete